MTDDLAEPRPWFRAATVAEDLGDRVSLAWVVDTDAAHELVPDACVDVVWLPDGSVRVCGPEVEGWRFRPLDGTEAVGVRFRPGHAAPVLGSSGSAVPRARRREAAGPRARGPRAGGGVCGPAAPRAGRQGDRPGHAVAAGREPLPVVSWAWRRRRAEDVLSLHDTRTVGGGGWSA